MLQKNHRFLKCCLLFFIASEAQAVTLTSGQTDYTTSSNITTSGIGISSSLSGTALSLDKIKNLHIITTGNSGATSGAYGIKSGGNYNQITNASGAAIFTTGSSGRGVSVVNNSIVINAGSISTQGTTSYGIYAGGNSNAVNNSGSINTTNTTSYGIYLSGDNNSATSSGSIATRVYGIYVDGNANQISNSGTILTSTSSSAHGIYVSAGTGSNASSTNYTTVNNSGTINSSGNGIYAKDNYVAITNSGTITTAAGSSIYGIRIEGDNSTVTNSGTINSTNYAIYNSGANVVINNWGSLVGAVRIGDGVLNILGGNISGIVDGASNVGSVNVSTNFSQTAAFSGLNDLTINSNSTLNSNSNISANRILIDANSALTLGSGSSLSGAIQGLSNSVGTLNISGISFSSGNSIGISGSALANLNINSGGLVSASNNIYASNIFLDGTLNFLSADNLSIFGSVAGSGFGAINVGSKNQTISGNFSLNSGDELAVMLKNGGVGSLAVGGFASIDANSKLAITTSSSQGYIASGTQYNLVNGASGSVINSISDANIFINGENSNIYGLLKFSTTATSGNLVLNIDRLSAAQITQNKNAQNIYQSLSNIGASGGGKLLEFQEYLDGSGFSGEEMTKTLNQLAPQSSKAALATTNSVVGNSIAIAENRLEKINHRNSNYVLKNSFWAQGFGGAVTQKAIADDDGYKTNSKGIAFGADQETFDSAMIGASFSFAQSNIKSLDQSKTNYIDTYQANIYGSKNFEKYFFDAIAGLAWNQFNSSRAITAVDANAGAKYSGQTYALKIKSGFVNNLQNGFSIVPEASLNFLHNSIAGYSEKKADELNLKVGAATANFLEGRVGLNFGYAAKSEIPEFKKFSAAFKISYGHAFINDTPITTASFAGREVSFNSQISHLDNSSLKLGAELLAYHKDNTTFSADYNFEHKATSASHFILLKIREEF